jgi:tetratricopeptide (TPR) repeat protein
LRAGRTLIGLETAQAREQAQKFFEQAINVYEGDVAKEASTISEIATLYILSEPPQKQNALEYYDRAIHVAHEKNNKAAEVNAIIAKAGGFYSSTEPDGQHQIEQLYERAIAVYNNDPSNQAETLVRVGKLVFGSGREAVRVEKAKGYFAQAVNQASLLPDKKIAGSVHSNIASAYGRLQSLWPTAAQHYREALAYYESAGDQLNQATTLYRLITVNRRDAVTLADRALPLYASALPALKASGDQRQLGDAYYAMGSMFRYKKDYPAALDSFRKALEIRKALGNRGILIMMTESQIQAVQRDMKPSPK